MGLTLSYTIILSKGATNFHTRISALPLDPFPTNSNTIKSFFQFPDFSIIPVTTSIPLHELFDKPRFEGFKCYQLRLNIQVLILEQHKKIKLQNKTRLHFVIHYPTQE